MWRDQMPTQLTDLYTDIPKWEHTTTQFSLKNVQVFYMIVGCSTLCNPSVPSD